MRCPQVLFTCYKESAPDNCRAVWANYNEKGYLMNITDFYGEILPVAKGNKIRINDEIWILKGHLNKFYCGQVDDENLL